MSKISGIETRLVDVTERGGWLFVLVHSDEGLTGVGEGSHGRTDAEVARWIQALRPRMIGWDTHQMEAFRQRFFLQHEGHAYHTAVSGIEQALWDLLGQQVQSPVHQLLGGQCRDCVRMYANINRGTWNRSPSGFAESAQAAIAEGFTAIKCAPFDNVSAKGMSSRVQHAAVGMGIDRIREVRAAVGPNVDLMVDCHSRFSPATAIQMARELDDIGLTWLEDPVSLQDLESVRRVNEHTSMPIATGEVLRTLNDFRALLESRSAEYILPDVKYVGGILGLKKIATLAEAFGTLVTPHNPSGPVASAASIQCMATVPNFGILEYAWGEVDWRSELIDPAEVLEDGFAPVATQPGLGLWMREMDEGG